MANELVLNTTFVYNKNSIQLTKTIQNLRVTVTGNGIESLAAYTATTSDTALPLGNVSLAGGYLFINNTDGTNYVSVKTAVSGTEFCRLLPGDIILMRLAPGITAPSVQAHTASCVLNYCVLDL